MKVYHRSPASHWICALLLASAALGSTSCGGGESASESKLDNARSNFLGFMPQVDSYLVAKVLAGRQLNVYIPDASSSPGDVTIDKVTPATRPGLESRIKQAIMTWVHGIAPVSTVPLIQEGDIVFTAQNPDYTIKWGTGCSPSNAGSSDMQLCGNDGEDAHTILHEFGHGFGLFDLYNQNPILERGVMRWYDTSTQLLNDDFAGVRGNFCVVFPNQCKLRSQFNEAWCYGASARTMLGDFNGDGHADLLCHDVSTGNKWIAYADNQGRFTGATWTSTARWCSSVRGQVLVGDFNGDRRADLLCHDVSNGDKFIAYADEAGHFSGTGWSAAMQFCSGAESELLIGDFNGDGRSDFLCHGKTSGDLQIAYADQAGQFPTVSPISARSWCYGNTAQVLVGDFNGDRRDDALCHDVGSGSKFIAYADTSGVLTGTNWSSAMNWCTNRRLALVGKFHGDGSRSDMLCAAPDVNGALDFAYANADGQFPGIVTSADNGAIQGTAAHLWSHWCQDGNDELLTGDLDGNGASDLVCHNKGTGAVTTWLTERPGHNDFNLDGSTDLVWQNPETGQLGVWLLDGVTHQSDTLPDLPILPADTSTCPASSGWVMKGTADFNRDGQSDFVWHHGTTGEVSVWFQRATMHQSFGGSDMPDATIGPAWNSTVPASTGWELKGMDDFDRDGNADLLWYDGATGQLSVWFLNGTTHLDRDAVIGPAWNSTIPASAGWELKSVADFDRDGKVDLLWYNPSNGQLGVWFLNGTTHEERDAQIGPASTSTIPASTGWVLKGTDDFNRDHNVDILWHNGTTGEIGVWYLNGVTHVGHESIGPAWSSTVPANAGVQLLPR